MNDDHDEMLRRLRLMLDEHQAEAKAFSVLIDETDISDGLKRIYHDGVSEHTTCAEALSYAIEKLTKGE